MTIINPHISEISNLKELGIDFTITIDKETDNVLLFVDPIFNTRLDLVNYGFKETDNEVYEYSIPYTSIIIKVNLNILTNIKIKLEITDFNNDYMDVKILYVSNTKEIYNIIKNHSLTF